DKFAQQQRAKRAAIDAKSRGLTDRQAEREATEQRLKEQYGDNPLALNNIMSEQKKTWAAEDQLRGNWMSIATRGVVFIHSTPTALCPHITWALESAL
ncbi:DUF3145 family protein, partial [Streptomyces caeruleatus]